VKALRRFTVRAHLPERLVALERISINLRWSWDKPTQDLFAAVDPELWKQVGCDPVALLGQVSPKRLDELAVDESFVGRLDQIVAQLDDYLARCGTRSAPQRAPSSRTASRTSRWSSASPRCCRTTPAAWASSPATT
jgi:glucan phosphorylase